MTTEPTALLTPEGREVLARLAASQASGGETLALAVALRRQYPAGLVAAAMAQHELRLAAAAKFSRAADMLFTRAGYEQSSAEQVARHRARRLADACLVADLCCGIGGDLIALADGQFTGAREVLAVDRDAVHARLALHNAAVYGAAGRASAVVADVRDIRLAGLDAVFIDPARRAGPATATAGPASATGTGAAAVMTGPGSSAAARRFRAGESEPPLDWCVALAGRVAAVCVKAAPGLPAESLPPGWEAEFIAVGRDLKEAVLWSPALATAPLSPGTRSDQPQRRRATVLSPGHLAPAGGAGAAPCREPDVHTLVASPGEPVPVTEPGEYLLDPSPAVTRAGLVEDLARMLGGDSAGTVAKIDPKIAFLTVGRPVRTPFARTLRVLYSAPWHERQFARRLREFGIGAADIRRRGLAGDVETIRRRLKLSGPGRATVVITRVSGRPWGLICTDPAASCP